MNEPKRRFFSGDSLQQALVQAANHYNLDPEEIAYRSIEKKHGFIKVRRKVVIEVNPEAPRKERQERPVAAPSAPAPMAPAPPAPIPPAPAPPEAPRDTRPEQRPALDRPAPAGAERRERPPRGERRERTGRGDRGGDRRPHGRRGEDRGARDARPPRGEGGGARPPWPTPEEPRRREPGILEAGGLVTLPDSPRRVSERFPPAEGPQAAAAAKAAELLLRIAGLDLAPRVLQGEDR